VGPASRAEKVLLEKETDDEKGNKKEAGEV
jgi:hypothetical protein